MPAVSEEFADVHALFYACTKPNNMNRKPLLLLLFWIILAGYSSAQTPATINSIYYLIQNVQPYLSHTTFDIYSSVPEGQLFTQGNIICSYDTTIYGSYIVRSGEFTAHLSTDLDSSVYVLHVSDWGPDKIKISIISTGTTAIYDSLSPVPSALLSCQLNGSPANIGVGSAAFAFDGASMQQGSKYFNINTNLQQVFDSVYAISSFAPASETGIVHYSLVNFATDTIHQQIEFDISADDGAAGAFAAGIVFIDFNPAAFVSDLAAHSTITAPALYSGFVDNYGEHTLKVEVKTNGFAFITLPTRLAHIVLPYSTLLPTTLLSADSDLTASFPDLYYDSTAMSIMQYRGATASGRLRSGSIAAQIANTAYTSSLLTFDIQVQSNSGQYFHDATIDVTYDPSNFGSNVVANGNLSCTVSSSFNSTDYSFSSPTDVSANKFQIAVDGIYSVQSDYIAHNGSIPSLPYSTIASYTTIAACSLAVHNCCHSAAAGDYLSISSVSADYSTVSINQNGDPSDMNDDWYLDQNDNNSYTNGVFTGYDNSGTSLCTASTPTITSIDPLTITAGTFSVLTITGTGFGCATGVVYFTSDEPDISTMMHTQAIDIQSWTDNEIKV